jgi:hypothetical protein
VALPIACALTLSVDAVVFRTGLYRRVVEPESFAGETERVLRRARALPIGSRNVLLLGDSKIAEGFSEALANESAAGTGVHFFSGATGGSTPRCWYYMLREMDPEASRFQVVVVPVEGYDDEDGASDWADSVRDSRIVVFCLRAPDIWNYVASFHSPGARLEALRDSLLKGFILKDDVQAFLAHPSDRLSKRRQFEEHEEEWRRSYQGNPNTVKMEDARAVLARPTLPRTGDFGRYRKLWFGRIIEHYRGKPTRIIFCRIPAAPLRRPRPAIQFSRVIPALASRQVTVLDEDLFTDLERPEFFFDTVHMNSEGRKRFTPRLVGQVANLRLASNQGSR